MNVVSSTRLKRKIKDGLVGTFEEDVKNNFLTRWKQNFSQNKTVLNVSFLKKIW